MGFGKDRIGSWFRWDRLRILPVAGPLRAEDVYKRQVQGDDRRLGIGHRQLAFAGWLAVDGQVGRKAGGWREQLDDGRLAADCEQANMIGGLGAQLNLVVFGCAELSLIHISRWRCW